VRALLFGPTGIKLRDEEDKAGVIPKLRSYAYRQRMAQDSRVRDDKHNVFSKKYLTAYYLEEDVLKNKMSWVGFLDLDDYEKQQRLCSDSLREIVGRINKEKPDNAFLCMNMPYMRDSRFFPAPDIGAIRNFHPNVIIVLIEELHAVWQRVNILRELQGKTRSRFRLSELLAWRSASLWVADILAGVLKIPRYIVGVKHPPEMLYRLLFKPEILRVYASFPIGETRGYQDMRSKIDEIRYRLHEEFCVFDPLAIDDRVVVNKLEAVESGAEMLSGGKLVLNKQDRWPLKDGFPMCEDEDKLYPIEIELDEVKEVRTSVDNHIRIRDFLLINDVDAVVVIRPYIMGKATTGVTREVAHANEVGKPVYFYWPPEDGGRSTFAQSPFSGKGILLETLDDLINELKKEEQKKHRRTL